MSTLLAGTPPVVGELITRMVAVKALLSHLPGRSQALLSGIDRAIIGAVFDVDNKGEPITSACVISRTLQGDIKFDLRTQRLLAVSADLAAVLLQVMVELQSAPRQEEIAHLRDMVRMQEDELCRLRAHEREFDEILGELVERYGDS